MVNEAQLRDRFSDPINMTCADGTGIEKGAILTLTDPRTAIIATAAAAAVAGICAREKIASDGRTSVAVFRSGIFDVVASGAVTLGHAVVAAGVPSNTVKEAAVNDEMLLGIALETASDGETFQIELKPMSAELA